MNIAWSVFQTMIVLVILYGVGIYLKKKNHMTREREKSLSVILVDGAIPLAVFLALFLIPVRWNLFFAPLLVYATALFGGMLAYLAGEKIFKLNAGRTGALLLCAGGGGASVAGMALVGSLYQGQWMAFMEVIVNLELGISLLVLVVAAPVAIIFGHVEQGKTVVRRELVRFLYSPLLLAALAGLVAQLTGLPGKLAPVSGMALGFLGYWTILTGIGAAILAGSVLRPVNYKLILGTGIFIILLKLILQPVFMRVTGSFLIMDPLWCGVLAMVAAMPPSLYMVVFAKRYGCDAPMASALALITILISIITLPVVSYFVMRGN